MALNISGASIRHPVPALVLFTVLLVLGVLAFRAIPITRAPNVDVPIIAVTITESGAAPAELETQVTRKVEDAVAGVSGVKHISSSVTDGVSSTLVELRLEVGTDRALNDVKDAISRVRTDLPRTIDEPQHRAHRRGGPGDPDLRCLGAWDDAGTAILVHRRHRGARAAGRGGRRQGGADRRRDAGDPGGAGPGPAGGAGRHRGAGQRPVAGHQRGLGRRPRRSGRQGAGDPHPGQRQQPGRPGRHPHRAAWRPGGAAVRRRHRDRRVRGAAPIRPAGRHHAGGGVRGLPGQGRQRRGRRGPGQDTPGGTRGAAPAGHHHADRRLGPRHLRQLRVGHALAAGRCRAGDAGGVRVPARLARHGAGGGGAAAVDPAGVLLHEPDGVLAQLRQPAGDHPGHRHPGRRRHRRDREHRAPHAHGQIRLDRRDRGGGRDRAGGGGDHPDHRGGVRAGQLHGRHPRPVLQAVRADGRRRCWSRCWWRGC